MLNNSKHSSHNSKQRKSVAETWSLKP